MQESYKLYIFNIFIGHLTKATCENINLPIIHDNVEHKIVREKWR